MVVKNKKLVKPDHFRISKMSQETGLSVEEIRDILTSKKNGNGRVSERDLEYKNLQEAKAGFERLKNSSQNYYPALSAWNHFALMKVEKAATKSIMIEILDLCPEEGEAKRRLVKKLAFSYGFDGNI